MKHAADSGYITVREQTAGVCSLPLAAHSEEARTRVSGVHITPLFIFLSKFGFILKSVAIDILLGFLIEIRLSTVCFSSDELFSNIVTSFELWSHHQMPSMLSTKVLFSSYMSESFFLEIWFLDCLFSPEIPFKFSAGLYPRKGSVSPFFREHFPADFNMDEEL